MSSELQDNSFLEYEQRILQTSNQHYTAHSKKIRIAMYSHDTMGLGHMRRNLLIAHVLAHSHLKPVILMINGSYEMNYFSMPPGIDCLNLPALYKEMDGNYKSRRLDITLHELITLRSNVIRSVLEEFNPDVFIVDKVPRGALRELDPALISLCSKGRTRCVLGLRDVLDDPAAIRCEWEHDNNEDAIKEYFDAIWVYGDLNVYDIVQEYHFSPDIAAKVRYAGYLDQSMWLKFTNGDTPLPIIDKCDLSSDRYILCLVGGGQDGYQLAETFAHIDFPQQTYGIILTGPFMPSEVRERLLLQAANQPRLHVFDFINNPITLVSRANLVIAMGGYNTISEILSFKKRALIVPRVKPRVEQLIRAKCMYNLGLLDMLHPDDLDPEALGKWITSDPPLHRSYDRIDLNGLSRIPALLNEVIQHVN